jgi:hypothetical protein
MGIAAELRLPLKDFLPMQYKFMKNLKFYTDYAAELWRDTIEKRCIPELEFFAKLLEVNLE